MEKQWNNLTLKNIELGKKTEKSQLIKFVGGEFKGYECWVPVKLIKGTGDKTQISFTNEFEFTLVKNHYNNESKKWEKEDEQKVAGSVFVEHYPDNVIQPKA